MTLFTSALSIYAPKKSSLGEKMSNNPLKQYFRRPAIYIRLPSQGKYYDQSVIEIPENGELPVYPMTAIDEITSKTPDAVLNGQAVVDILQSCIPSIKNGWKINIIDLDYLIVAIRVASSGELAEISTTCPNCENEMAFDVNLMSLLGNTGTGVFEDTINVGELKIVFKPLDYGELNKNSLQQYEVQKLMVMLRDYEDGDKKTELLKNALQSMNNLITDMVVSTIKMIQTPETVVVEKEFIKEYLLNCDKSTSNMIKNHSSNIKTANQLKPIPVKCTNCAHEYDHTLVLNITDFFD